MEPDQYWHQFDYVELKNRPKEFDFMIGQTCPLCADYLKETKRITLPATVHGPQPTVIAVQFRCPSCKNRIIACRKSIEHSDYARPYRFFIIYKKDDFDTIQKIKDIDKISTS